LTPDGRVPIGLWSELGPGTRWTNEGVSRVVGFLVEGAAIGRKYTFHIVVPRGMAQTVREDLSHVRAVEGRDWQVWEPSAHDERHYRSDTQLPPAEAAIASLAEFANRKVPVEAWVVTFPHFAGSLRLTKPKATLFPDALPYDFPLGWLDESSWNSNGAWPKWRETATKVMADSNTVITFSRHVAERHAVPLCGVAREKIRVVPLAPPDLSTLLPFVTGRRRTSDSRARTADLLRAYMAQSGLDYLRDFPFEEIDFVAAATQDRPNKNLGLPADAVRKIVRDARRSLKLFATAPLHFGASWTRLPTIVKNDQLHRDLVSMPDLPRDVHAALFHCTSLVVHGSFFEGIVGALPFYEAASVGTPCVLANGPHVQELLEEEPDVEPFLYDPYDADGLAGLVLDVIANREQAVSTQAAIFERVSRNSWATVASRYSEAALSGATERATAASELSR
jgi:glycosyltransferase involved in cell wall biosynthesis